MFEKHGTAKRRAWRKLHIGLDAKLRLFRRLRFCGRRTKSVLLLDATAPSSHGLAEHGRRKIWPDVPEGRQRIGPFAEAPGLLRELGVNPAVVAAEVGPDLDVFQDVLNEDALNRDA